MVERESKTQSNAMTIIRHYNSYVYKNAQNMYTEKGRPDLTACVPVTVKRLLELYGENKVVGLFVGIEMKRPGKINNTSLAQEIVGRQIQKAGGIWLANDDPTIIETLLQTLIGGNNGV